MYRLGARPSWRDAALRHRWLRALMLSVLLTTSGCAGKLSNDVVRGASAYEVIPAADPAAALEEYVIGPLDTLDISVFREPDLSLKSAKVDAGGTVLMPLIGKIKAAGLTPAGLSQQIAVQLSTKYLEDPQVSVVVVSAVSQRVAVEGSVNEAGVFEIQGRTSLLEALAMAKGTSRTAALDQIVVFRTIEGKRNAAVFNVAQIRRGASPDPEIRGNDLIVVGFSNLKAGWRDFLSASPLLTIFRPF